MLHITNLNKQNNPTILSKALWQEARLIFYLRNRCS